MFPCDKLNSESFSGWYFFCNIHDYLLLALLYLHAYGFS